jgi:hypothetical protein
MRLLAFLLFVGIAVGQTGAQSKLQIDPNVVLAVTIANDQREFRIGEAIPLQLSFSSTVKRKYELNMAQYDRTTNEGSTNPTCARRLSKALGSTATHHCHRLFKV